MARYVWIISLFSPREGKWVRMNLGPHHASSVEAWIVVESLWDFLVAADEFDSIRVIRTIAL